MKTISIDDTAHRIVKLMCVENDVKINDAINVLIDKWDKDKGHFGVFKYLKSLKNKKEIENL